MTMRYVWKDRRSVGICVFAVAALCAIPLSAVAQYDTLRVYFLGGQSNMDGYGRVSELPDRLSSGVEGVWIFQGNPAEDDVESADGRGVWSPLEPGHGAGFGSDGKENRYADRFGVELTFAERMLELRPHESIALIKYSRGGTSIDSAAADRFGSWAPDFVGRTGVNQYDHALATMRAAMSTRDVNGDGLRDVLIPAGIVWMQGESDAAFSAEIALRYARNLSRLMNLLRSAFHADVLPVIIGRIADSEQDEEDGKVWNQGEIVRAMQAAYVESDPRAALVTSTDNYAFSDPWHYDTGAYLDLGRQFADAMADLLQGAEESSPDTDDRK
jgi:hypothetical protein